MRWIKKEKDLKVVKDIMAKYDLDPLVASIMVRRGITTPEKILFYMVDSERYLHQPFLFIEMEDAVDRILEAKEEGEKIRIFGDRDADGITSTVILYNALTQLGIDVSWQVPLGDDDYGLTKNAISDFAEDGGTLFITVDCGISNYEEIQYASSLGVDAIITDHHNPPEAVPNAVALLNPKMEDSGYPFEYLAGCGVAFKLAVALEISQTPLYKRNFTLLNIEEGNEVFRVSAIKVRNLIEVDRILESVVPHIFDLENSRLADFLVGQQIVVFEQEIQRRYLKQCFGTSAEIILTDLAPDIWKRYGKLRGKSLFKLKTMSTLGRFKDEDLSELDIFFNLYITFMLDRHHSIIEKIYSDIEFVTLGTIADQMQMEDENRILVSLGLKKFNSRHKNDQSEFNALSPSLIQFLYEKNLMEKPLTAQDLGWNITTLLNATGRLGVPDKAVTFLIEPNAPNLRNRAQEICSINEERKGIVSKLWDKLLPLAKKSFEELNEKFVIVAGKDIHRGVTGLLASRFCDYFNVPTMVAAFLDDKIMGSLRSQGLNVKDLIENFTFYLNDFGGHDHAAGFNLPLENWDNFYKAFIDVASDLNFDIDNSEKLFIDAELTPTYFTPDIINIASVFEPYGEGNPPLLFAIRNVKIVSLELIGKKSSDHVRMTIEIGEYKWVALFWNAASRVGVDFTKDDIVDIVFRLNRNYFRSQENLQLMIQDIKISSDKNPFIIDKKDLI